MQIVFSTCAYLAGLLLDVMVIGALLRTGYRRYPFLLLYVIADFLTTVIEIRPGLGYGAATPEAQHMYALIFWWNERFLQLLVFALVISLLHKATAGLRPRRMLLLGIMLGTAAFAGITFLIHFSPDPPIGSWMTPWTRDLNFGAAILDLGLWAVLIGTREKDYRLLMISGALGIQLTGGAMGYALRDMAATGRWIMADVVYLTNLACLYIWWQVFRRPEKPTARPRLNSEPANLSRPSTE